MWNCRLHRETGKPEPILIEGLKRLEYRGYDSAGLAVIFEEDSKTAQLEIIRAVGRVRVLEEAIESHGGDQRKALVLLTPVGRPMAESTTPMPTPIRDDPEKGHGIAIIHNGIIENYNSLRTLLIERGHQFHSETDTEVLAHLIGELYKGDLEKAVQAALREVTGAYAIAAVCKEEAWHLGRCTKRLASHGWSWQG